MTKPRNGPPANPAETASERVQALLEQLGGSAGNTSVRLFRMTNGRPAYLGLTQLSPQLYDDVKAEHGGGDFRADVFDVTTGKVITNFPFSIYGVARAIPAAEALPATPAPAPPGGTEILQKILERLERLERPQPPAPVVRDPIEDFTRMAQAMAAFNGTQKNSNLLETVGMVFDLQDRVASRLPDPAAPGESPIVALARELRPLVPLLAHAQEPGQDVVQHAPAPAGATPPAAAPGMPAAAPSPAGRPPLKLVDQIPPNADPILKLLGQIPLAGRAAIRSMAATDTDPASACNVCLSMLGPQQLGELAEQVPRAEFLDVMLAGMPTWAPYRPWFGEFVAAIRASLQDDEPEAGSGGDAAPTDDSPVEALG